MTTAAPVSTGRPQPYLRLAELLMGRVSLWL